MFARSPQRHGAYLIVSVSAASVSAGVVECDDESANVRVHVEGELQLEDRPQKQAFALLKQLAEEKGKAALSAYVALPHHKPVRTIYGILHAPWAQPEIVSGRKRFDVDTHITDALLDACAREALGKRASDSGFLHASLLSVRLNGYPTERPEGKRARVAEVVGISAAAEPAIKQDLLHCLQTVLPSAEIQLRSGARAMAAFSGSHSTEDALICSLGAESVELLIVRDGVPAACGTVPVGMRSILQSARPAATVEDSLTVLRMKGRGECTTDACTELETGLLKIEPDLAQTFGESLAKMSMPARLPNAVSLYARRGMDEWFSHFLGRIDFAPFTIMGQPFTVRSVVPEGVIEAGRKDMEGPADIELALAAHLVETERLATP